MLKRAQGLGLKGGGGGRVRTSGLEFGRGVGGGGEIGLREAFVLCVFGISGSLNTSKVSPWAVPVEIGLYELYIMIKQDE